MTPAMKAWHQRNAGARIDFYTDQFLWGGMTWGQMLANAIDAARHAT